MLEHIAIPVYKMNDVEEFYQKILGFQIEREQLLSAELSDRIFGINHHAKIILMRREELFLELFICDLEQKSRYNHVCLLRSDRSSIIDKASEKNYKIVTVNRGDYELIFVYDRSGNIFEIKEPVTK